MVDRLGACRQHSSSSNKGVAEEILKLLPEGLAVGILGALGVETKGVVALGARELVDWGRHPVRQAQLSSDQMQPQFSWRYTQWGSATVVGDSRLLPQS